MNMSWILPCLFLAAVFGCKVRNEAADGSAVATDALQTNASFTEFTLSAPADENGFKVYFYNPRIASELYWDLKTKKLDLSDEFTPVIKMFAFELAARQYEDQGIATGDSAFVVDVYIDDGFLKDTFIGRVAVRVDEFRKLKSGAQMPIWKNKMNGDVAPFEVTVTKK